MPDKRLIFLLLILSGRVVAQALQISGTTTSGMAFSGLLISATHGELLLENGRGGTRGQWGIPLGQIATLTLHEEPGDERGMLGELEVFGPLLARWDDRTRRRLLAITGKVVEDGYWKSGYNWSSRLLELELNPADRNRLALLRAWCLLEMGLIQSARKAAHELATAIDPMEAPTRFCWLMTRLALEAGETGTALKWARLPGLQIPSREDPLASELAALLARTETGGEVKL